VKLDDYLVKFGNDKFRGLLNKTSKSLHKIVEKKLMKKDVDRELFLSYPSPKTKLIYEVERIMSIKGGTKIVLAIFKEDNLILSDTPNISTSKKRTEVARKCERGCGVKALLIEKDLQDLERKCKGKIVEQSDNVNKSKDPILTEEDEARALELLKSPNLIDEISEDIERLGVIGEKSNAILIYFVITSRILANPISVVLKGSSSSGKSFLITKILQLIPPSETHQYSYLSTKALFYKGAMDLKHKVLYVDERPGAEASDYSIRLLQSEKRLKVGITTEDSLKGGFKTIDIEVEGPVAYIETTTKAMIHSENETRVFSLYPDESSEQTLKIQESQKAIYSIEEKEKFSAESIIKKHNALQKFLTTYKVKIPFVHLIKFPHLKTRYRRDLPRFLSLIECSALLHQFQRVKRIIDRETYVTADMKDYEIAYKLIMSMIEFLSEIPPKSRQLLMKCKKIALQKTEFTRNDIQRVTNWKLYEIANYIEPLVSGGYLEEILGRKGQKYVYRIVKTNIHDLRKSILSPEELKIKYKKQRNLKT